MNNKVLRSISLVTGFISGLLLMSKWDACNAPKIKTVVQTVYDSSVKYITAPVEKLIIRDSIFYPVPFLVQVDTAMILQQYFTAYYQQQILRDSLLQACISDSIYQNRIIWRGFSYKILRPQTVTHNIIQSAQPRTHLYIGAELSTAGAVSPSIIIDDKHARLYSIRTNLFERQPNLALGIHFKLLGK